MRRHWFFLTLAILALICGTAYAVSISKTWHNDWLTNSSLVSSIDDEVDNLSIAIQERAQNGGQYWPSSNAAMSGCNVIQSGNYVANEWSVYKSDLATKAFTLTDSKNTLNQATDIVGDASITGNATIGGNLSVTGTFSGGGREVWLVWHGYSYLASAPSHPILGSLDQPQFAVPVSGTITHFYALPYSISTASHVVYLKKATMTWVADKATADGTASTVSSLAIASTEYGARNTALATSVSAGDRIFVTSSQTGGAAAVYMAALVRITIP